MEVEVDNNRGKVKRKGEKRRKEGKAVPYKEQLKGSDWDPKSC